MPSSYFAAGLGRRDRGLPVVLGIHRDALAGFLRPLMRCDAPHE